MSDEDLVFETKDDRRYAPSINVATPEVDDVLVKELAAVPDKMAFKIGEVAELAGVKPYVLRYWETEFKVLKPQKSKHNQRIYSRKDVETVFMIKKLLYKDRFSIEGARSALRNLKKESKKVSTLTNAVNQFESVRDDLHDLILDIQQIRTLFQ